MFCVPNRFKPLLIVYKTSIVYRRGWGFSIKLSFCNEKWCFETKSTHTCRIPLNRLSNDGPAPVIGRFYPFAVPLQLLHLTKLWSGISCLSLIY